MGESKRDKREKMGEMDNAVQAAKEKDKGRLHERGLKDTSYK
jgi:hypothetical protein